MQKEQQLNNNDGILNALFNTFLGFLGIRRAEAIKAEAEVEAEWADDIAETKAKVKEIERNAKIEKRIAKSKKAIDVKKLKSGKNIYIQYPGEETKRKEVFIKADDKYVYTNVDKHPYARVFNWHGRPVINEAMYEEE